jgi:hypothetical protein
MRRNAGKRIDLYNLIKMYKQLDGDASKVNVGYIKSLDLEDVEEEIRRVRDFIADIQHFEPLIREQERLEGLEAQEQRVNLDALQLQELEDRLSGIRTRRASDVIHELEGRIARLERSARRRETPQALVELGRRGRDHVNTQIFEWLGSYGDDLKQYVAVDVEDQVEFFDDPSSSDVEGTYVKLNVELEYIDRADDQEKSERTVFHLTVPIRSIKQDRDGVYDEDSIFNAILHTDSADLEEQ